MIQYDFLLKSKEEIPIKADEINNPDLLASLFFSLEGSIINEMKIRDETMKEKNKQKIEFDSQILNLQQKLEENKKNLKSLYKELETQKTRYNTHNYQSIIDDASVYIY